MTNDGIRDLYLQHRTGQDKYTYFLLAIAASAVAFAVQKTSGVTLTWSLAPLGVAVIAWGLSFYCGCRMANYNLLKLQYGVHPEQPDRPEYVNVTWVQTAIEAAKQGTRDALESNINEAMFHAKWQFRLLILGAVFFLIWHLVEMVLRTNAA